MRDEECVQFLQWALPHLHMRWPGFRKVRRQVCKRIQRQLHQLAIDNIADYRHYLQRQPQAWQSLDQLCRVTISRFYRDKQMFAFLEQVVLPKLAQRALARGDDCLRIWSVGAGGGEEPYSIAMVWRLRLQAQFPQLRLQIVASDADANLIQRARAACYAYGSVKNLPPAWRQLAFTRHDERYCLKPPFREEVRFTLHDIRHPFDDAQIAAGFDLVLCRNLVFTYFDEPLQQQILARLLQVLLKGGALVLGIHETLPAVDVAVRPWSERLRIFEKTA